MSKLCLATSAPTVGPDVKNRVNWAKSNNQCTLEQIGAKSVDFSNFVQNWWFFVFPAEMWRFFGIYSEKEELPYS
jgi:hypothetical protein